MANYKVAYGKRGFVTSAINGGIIPPGCIIITEDTNEILFYDLSRNLKTYESRHKFSSKREAEEWIKIYDCSGQIITIQEGNRCNAYIVDYSGKLQGISSSTSSGVSVQADYLIDDPDDPAYIRNKPTSLPISFIEGLEEVLLSKVHLTNQSIPGALVLVDSTGNITGSGITLQEIMSTMNQKVEITDPVVEGALLVAGDSGSLKSSGITTQELFSTLSNKVEVAGSITPGSLMVATGEGNLQCCGISYSDILLKKDVITGSTTSTVTLESSGIYVVQIPTDILKYPSVQVYHNGMLLVENTHYTVSDKFITLIGHSTYSGDLFTFVGYGSTGTLSDVGSNHTHSNKSVLDSITKEMVDLWNSLNPSDDVHYVSREELFGNDGRILRELLPSNVVSGLELGYTSETAFRGDYGLIAYQHSKEDHAPSAAQENKIEEIAIGGALLPIVNKLVTIPVGDTENLGVVKSSTEDNKIFIEEDGTMSVNSVDATRLRVTEGEELILVSGDSSN